MKHTETQSDYLGLAGEGAKGKAWEWLLMGMGFIFGVKEIFQN